jgi:DNA polymerase-3 subunit beta
MFDLEVAKNELLAPLLLVSGAVDKRQSLAILSHILFEVKADTLTLTATDLEMEISAKLNCSSHCSDSELTIPAKKFIDIIRSLDDAVLARITQKDNAVLIKAVKSQFKLAILPAEQFPRNAEDAAEALELSIPKSGLIQLLQSTHFAMSQQDVRIFLNGLLLEIDNSSITAVATDGHRMAICKLPCNQGMPLQRFLLPRKSVQEMLRVLNTVSDEIITIHAGKSNFGLKTREYTFNSKLIEAKFPPYAKAIPRANDKFILIDKESLKRALSRIVILAHEKSRAVVMHIQQGSITLIANNQAQEEAIESVEAQVDGNEIKIGINAGYLLDVLNFIPDATIRLSLSTTDSSILVEPLEEGYYQYIIMPMKL